MSKLILSGKSEHAGERFVATTSALIRSWKSSKGLNGIFLRRIAVMLEQLMAVMGLSSILRNCDVNWPS